MMTLRHETLTFSLRCRPMVINIVFVFAVVKIVYVFIIVLSSEYSLVIISLFIFYYQ